MTGLYTICCKARVWVNPKGGAKCGKCGAWWRIDGYRAVRGAEDALTLDEVDHFVELLHHDHLQPVDF